MAEPAPKRRKIAKSLLEESLKFTEAWAAVPHEAREPFSGFATLIGAERQLIYYATFSCKVFYDRFTEFVQALDEHNKGLFWSHIVLVRGAKDDTFTMKRREQYFARYEAGQWWKKLLDAGLVEDAEWSAATLEQLLEVCTKTWTAVPVEGREPFPVVLVRTDEDGHATQYYASFSCETFAERFHEFLAMLARWDGGSTVDFWNSYVLADDGDYADADEVAEFGKAAYCKEYQPGICWKKLLVAGLVEDADWLIATAASDPNNAQEPGSDRYSWEEMKKFGNARAVFRTTNFS